MAETDPDQLADRLEQEAQAMQRHNDELGDAVARARQDWETKRADPNVPGAPPSEEGSADGAGESPGPEAPPEDAHPGEGTAVSDR
jgi:hypothetical protein